MEISARHRWRWALVAVAVVVTAAAAGCATLQEIAALRHVAFALDRTSDVTLAGVRVDRLREYEDLSAGEVARIAQALAGGELPLSLTVHVRADNPEDNVTARLVRMDWTLLIRERETVSGVLEEEYRLPPGESTDVPVRVSLDLREFFEGSARDLVAIGLDAAGRGGPPRGIALRAVPVIDTALGPIRYPNPIVIGVE